MLGRNRCARTYWYAFPIYSTYFSVLKKAAFDNTTFCTSNYLNDYITKQLRHLTMKKCSPKPAYANSFYTAVLRKNIEFPFCTFGVRRDRDIGGFRNMIHRIRERTFSKSHSRFRFSITYFKSLNCPQNLCYILRVSLFLCRKQ